ncbi:hypothetical protein [Amycolatopsis orientalis]|uniref:hypothetical protein n=1 Tax=Amycolatopsis orientalis TaxID=31958 RepID=UPI000B29D293|nr:hypothetical protein [Amycolatopsis orientalis]
MADLRHKTSFGGRLLAYADETSMAVAHPITGSDVNSGMVIAKAHAPAEVRRLRELGYANPLVVDVCAWKKEVATVSSPMDLPAGEGLFPITLEDWSEGVLSSGASNVVSVEVRLRLGLAGFYSCTTRIAEVPGPRPTHSRAGESGSSPNSGSARGRDRARP